MACGGIRKNVDKKISVIISIKDASRVIKELFTSLAGSGLNIVDLTIVGNKIEELRNVAPIDTNMLEIDSEKKRIDLINKTMAEASGEIIFFIGDNAIFPKGSLHNLLDCLLSDDKIALAVPVTNSSLGPQRVDMIGRGEYRGDFGYGSVEKLDDWAMAYQEANKGRKIDTYEFTESAFFIRSSTARLLAGADGHFFDPVFTNEYFRNVDVSRRIVSQGLKTTICGASYVHVDEEESRYKTQEELQAGEENIINDAEDEKNYRKKWDRKQKVIAMMLVHNEDIYLEKCLDGLQKYTDGAVILDDRSTNEKTMEILKSGKYKGFIRDIFRNPDDYKRDKERDEKRLNQMVAAQDPDWILQIDPDQLFEDKMQTALPILTNPVIPSTEGYLFRVYHLWDAETQYRGDSSFNVNYEIKLIRNTDDYKKDNIVNIEKIIATDLRVKHFGYLKRSDRLRRSKLIEEADESKKELYEKLNNKKGMSLLFWNDLKKGRTVSLCMIVKNETDQLRRCLKSAKGLYDELIVVWSGDNEDTKKILEEYGAKIIRYIWKGDFSDARNTGIRKATKDWVLWLDADEYIDPGSVQRWRKCVDYADNIAISTWKVDLNKDLNENNRWGFLRLFRNGQKVNFAGKVHEVPKLPKYKSPIASNLEVFHQGYFHEAMPEKNKRNKEIALKEIKTNPKNHMGYFEMGRITMGRKKWKEALKYFEKGLRLSRAVNPVYFISIANCYMNLSKYDEAIKICHEALAMNNLYAELYMIIGSAYIKKDMLDNAIFIYGCLLNIKKPLYTEVMIQDANYSEKPLDVLAKLYLKRGMISSAKKCFDRIKKKDPSFENKLPMDALSKLRGFDDEWVKYGGIKKYWGDSYFENNFGSYDLNVGGLKMKLPLDTQFFHN